MSRYLPFVKSAARGRAVETGPTPAAYRFPLDEAARHAPAGPERPDGAGPDPGAGGLPVSGAEGGVSGGPAGVVPARRRGHARSRSPY